MRHHGNGQARDGVERPQARAGEAVGVAHGLGGASALRQVLWLQGANGSGKTTLLRAIAGLDGAPAPQPGVSLMLQRPEDQVVNPTVGGFVGDADAVEKLGLDAEEHPLDLPAAKLRLAQAAFVFAQGRAVVLLDEPDVGLDDSARAEFHALLVEVLNEGRAVVMACHDPGFIGEVGEYAGVKPQVITRWAVHDGGQTEPHKEGNFPLDRQND